MVVPSTHNSSFWISSCLLYDHSTLKQKPKLSLKTQVSHIKSNNEASDGHKYKEMPKMWTFPVHLYGYVGLFVYFWASLCKNKQFRHWILMWTEWAFWVPAECLECVSFVSFLYNSSPMKTLLKFIVLCILSTQGLWGRISLWLGGWSWENIFGTLKPLSFRPQTENTSFSNVPNFLSFFLQC